MNTSKTYVFACPVCRKTYRTDMPGEPCCTGPSESRHEHPLTVMRLVRVDDRQVDPVAALRRSLGPLRV